MRIIYIEYREHKSQSESGSTYHTAFSCSNVQSVQRFNLFSVWALKDNQRPKIFIFCFKIPANTDMLFAYFSSHLLHLLLILFHFVSAAGCDFIPFIFFFNSYSPLTRICRKHFSPKTKTYKLCTITRPLEDVNKKNNKIKRQK